MLTSWVIEKYENYFHTLTRPFSSLFPYFSTPLYFLTHWSHKFTASLRWPYILNILNVDLLSSTLFGQTSPTLIIANTSSIFISTRCKHHVSLSTYFILLRFSSSTSPSRGLRRLYSERAAFSNHKKGKKIVREEWGGLFASSLRVCTPWPTALDQHFVFEFSRHCACCFSADTKRVIPNY